jgi:phosphonate transport system substrate-binding protein
MIKIFSILACLIFLNGCSEDGSKPATEIQKEAETLTIGLIPEQNIFDQLDRYQVLADYLNKKTGINIKMKVLTRYEDIVDNFGKLGLDGAFYGSFTYVLAHMKQQLDVIARPQSVDGSSTYSGLLFVRKDRHFTGVNDMRGKVFAFVSKSTTAGYLLPLAYFKQQGIKDYKTFFKETYFTGTHEDAIYDVLNHRADFGAAKNTVFYRMAEKDERIKKELQIIERSPEMPENALAFKRALDDSIKKKIKDALLDMHNSPEGTAALKKFGAVKFIETSENDYAPVYGYIDQIGLDLVSFDYANE